MANEIGYKLAEKITHGNHAFIVATHIDKAHIHNHIIFNSTNLTCDKKFRDFLGSGKAIGRISDRLCLEYGLSIVKKSNKTSKSYGKWLEEKEGFPPSHSDNLREHIFKAMAEKPVDFEEFLAKMRDRGYTIKRGKHLAFRNKDMGKYIRLRSLGEDFSEENLRKVVDGSATLSPPKRKRKTPETVEENINLLIDIDKALKDKGAGYERWAKKFNLKQMAKTVNYLSENNLIDYQKLKEKSEGITLKLDTLTAEIKSRESQLSRISEVQENIVNYAKTKEIYNSYQKSGYSKKFKEEHITEIILHQTARNFFKTNGFAKFPKMADLKKEYAKLNAEKRKFYGEYYSLKRENQDIIVAKTNIEVLLDIQKDSVKEKNERKTRE